MKFKPTWLMVKRLIGSNNWNFDSTIYTFKNKKTFETISMTRNEFISKFQCPAQNVYHLIKGTRKSVVGWALV